MCRPVNPRSRAAGAFALALTLLLGGRAGLAAQDGSPVASPAALSANATVFATGLDNPRGLKFGPDGALYVAEAGTGGTTSTEGQCPQVVAPIGPYTGGMTSRISKIGPDGARTMVVDGLPSDQTSPALGSLVGGVADVAFVGDALYYLMAGAGCSHGHADAPNGVFRVEPNGATALVADLSAFVRANPVATPNPADFEPDEGAYAMAELGGQLYVTESNHGAVDRVGPDGATARVIDISASQGHVVPTAIVVGPDGALYVGNLTPAPYPDGAAVVYRLTPDGQLARHAEGLTAVLGLAFDAQGRLYALETSTGNTETSPFLVPGSGRVVRQSGSGWETVASGFSFPTGMVFGADGALYVSDFGFGFPPGSGRIVRVDLAAPPPGSAGSATPAP